MRTLQQIMDSLEQAIYLRARERESNELRDELLFKQRSDRFERAQATLASMGKLNLDIEDGALIFYDEIERYLPYFEQLDEIDSIYIESGRAPQ